MEGDPAAPTRCQRQQVGEFTPIRFLRATDLGRYLSNNRSASLRTLSCRLGSHLQCIISVACNQYVSLPRLRIDNLQWFSGLLVQSSTLLIADEDEHGCTFRT